MTDGIKALLGDAHGLLAFLLVIAATVLVVLKVMPLDEWQNFVKWIFAAFAGTHALVSGATAFANRGKPDAAPMPTPAQPEKKE